MTDALSEGAELAGSYQWASVTRAHGMPTPEEMEAQGWVRLGESPRWAGELVDVETGGAMTIWIPGVQKSTQTGSIVRVGTRAFPKRRGTEWSAYVRLQIATQRPATPLSGPVQLAITFIMPDLASGKRTWPTKRPDLDNLLKGLLDCGNHLLWEDDSQIVDLKLEKRYARNTDRGVPGVLIQAWEK